MEIELDEVIQEYKEEAEGQRRAAKSLNCIELDFHAEKNEQIAEWLEELKAYRANNGISKNVYRLGYKFAYNKAIDDFVDELKLKHIGKESEE